jgi:hypothetical protein
MKIDWKRSLIVYAIIAAALLVFIYLVLPSGEEVEAIPISQVVTMSQEHRIDKIVVEGDALSITATDGTKYTSTKETGISITEYGMDLTGVNVDVKEPSGIDWGTILLNFLPLLLLAGLFLFILSQARGANNQAMSFGRSRAKLFSQDKPTVTFEDVAGWKRPSRPARGGGIPEIPREVPGAGRPHTQGRAAHRAARHRQDAFSQGCCRRGRHAVFLYIRFRIRGDVCGRGRFPRARPL